MLFRAIALSLALLIGIGAIVPLATQMVEAGPKKVRKYKKHRYKKYSKKWWRQYRARQRRKRALALRRRAMRLHQLRMANLAKAGKIPPPPALKVAKKTEEPVTMLPSGEPAPRGWTRSGLNGGELMFRVDDAAGTQVASAAISVVGPAMGDTVVRTRNSTLAGIPVTSLRREVINRMIRENGWVVNDYQKEIGGRSVYVVVAQSQAGSRLQSRMFYFTEVDGKIYSLSTNTGTGDADRIAEESERVINALRAKPRPTQQAVLE